MILARKIWSVKAAIGPLCAFLTLGSAFADESASQDEPASLEEPASRTDAQSAAVKSLERILKQASDSGLLEIAGEEVSAKDTPVAEPDTHTARGMSRDRFDCQAADVLDLWKYADVDSIDAVSLAKSKMTTHQAVDAVIPVAQTYLSLGLGTEAVANLESFNTPEANLLTALGRIVDGVSAPSDAALIQSYAACSSRANFWSLVVQPALDDEMARKQTWVFSGKHREILAALPKHLGDVVTVQVGIHAAELGQQILAENLLSAIEPRSRFGAAPKNSSDERLYFFAVLRGLKGDPNSKTILKYLAKRDGVYQVKALMRLVQSGASKDAGESEEMVENLLSVQQQYRGKTSARQASLEIVKQQAAERQYAYAIDLAKSEFYPTHSERKLAVNNIGGQLSTDMELDDSAAQINALDGYLYDTQFFEVYENLDVLQYLAHKTAVDFDFPEIAKSIALAAAPEVKSSSKFSKDVVLSQVKSSLRDGEIETAVKSGLPHMDDERFSDLLVETSLTKDTGITADKIEAALGGGAKVLKFQAEAAGQRGQWDKAQSALRSLEKLDEEAFDQADTLAIVDYVAANRGADKSNLQLNNVHDAVSLQKNLGSDINLVKAFLTNG